MKEALSKARTDIHNDNTKLQTSITSKIEKLQAALVTENDIMDQLSIKPKIVKVVPAHLSDGSKEIDELKFKKIVIKNLCCRSETIFLNSSRDS